MLLTRANKTGPPPFLSELTWSGLREQTVKGLPHLSNVPIQGVLIDDQCQPAGGVWWCVMDSVSGPSQMFTELPSPPLPCPLPDTGGTAVNKTDPNLSRAAEKELK